MRSIPAAQKRTRFFFCRLPRHSLFDAIKNERESGSPAARPPLRQGPPGFPGALRLPAPGRMRSPRLGYPRFLNRVPAVPSNCSFPFSPDCAIILSAEETALRFLRAAAAAQFHKNGSLEPLLWNSAIVAMRISTGASQRSRGRCKVFGQFRPKTLHLCKAGNLESQGFQGFRLCSVRISIRGIPGGSIASTGYSSAARPAGLRIRISKEIPCAPRTGGVRDARPAHKNLPRFAR